MGEARDDSDFGDGDGSGPHRLGAIEPNFTQHARQPSRACDTGPERCAVQRQHARPRPARAIRGLGVAEYDYSSPSWPIAAAQAALLALLVCAVLSF